ncbi:thioredoxin family protein [Sporolactobacillus kofuensis]|uniref:Thioredoxin family protein n=1 Tax=Sporolactobacillus kofuensis TaxID=269672 RepID=A0ABW1WDM6_9BACL|nr:thioredoxin family protein [Sporolactobacillus kofuensis]MCO7176654.1 thioredoxin family protein [Sporolactobacillus kofuensis]
MKAIETTEEFQQVINTPKTIMIKFETTWCPDCKRLNMYIDDIIKDFDFEWYSADRDQFPELGRDYQVLGIPSLLAFKNGKKIAHLRADDQSPEEIRAYLETIEA